MENYNLSHLKQLEAEAIYVLREAAAQFNNPALLFSGGKDSVVMAYLAYKAFYPARIPFPLVHVDTGHNFDECYTFRDAFVEKYKCRLVVGSVQESINKGEIAEETGLNASRNTLQTTTLLSTIEDNQFDGAGGGGRRDEEKARAKERFFSHRNDFGEWQPQNQRPELWNIFNGRKQHGEHFRFFPISNWTEMDIWQYIKAEEIELPSLYFAQYRNVIQRGGTYLEVNDLVQPRDGEEVQNLRTRFRTMGDATITGAVLSDADDLDKIIEEVATARETERGNRVDDKCSETSMEDRKKEGYF